ncbi:MAG: hypothetical protein ABIR96_13130 [Bdellovibrionota bacterium]
MTFQEQVVAILQERSFEIRDGASKMEVIEATDFEQIAMDITELLSREYGLEPEQK